MNTRPSYLPPLRQLRPERLAEIRARLHLGRCLTPACEARRPAGLLFCDACLRGGK